MTTWLHLPKPWLFLAPMAAVADWAFREVCYRSGAEITVSHLIPVASLTASPRKILPVIGARHGGRPFIVQLIGHRPEEFQRAARIVTDNLPVVGIDINMGCPVAPVVSAGSGSALLRAPERAAAIVAEVCAGTHLPVSVKLRSGWDSPVAPDLAPLLEAAGAKALFVHGRTREQHYHGPTDLQVIADVKRAVSIPVVGNGNVVSVATARRMLDVAGVDGVMVGRGAVGNPWLFGELQAELKGNHEYRRQAAGFGELIREHVRLEFAIVEPKKAARAIRRHLVHYCSGSPSAAVLRKELETLRTLEDIEKWIAALEAAGEPVRGELPRLSSPDVGNAA